jgi:hypothetical protein
MDGDLKYFEAVRIREARLLPALIAPGPSKFCSVRAFWAG